MSRTFGELLRTKEHVLGQMSFFGYPEIVEIAAYAGFDFVVIDEEHGSDRSAPNSHAIRAAQAAGIVPFIKVPSVHDGAGILRALDSGAAGVVVPDIQTRADAELAVAHAKYEPLGKRGASSFTRAGHFGALDQASYYARANEDVSVVALIEDKEGVRNFDDIVAVEGLDAVFFGPVDLSMSLGVAAGMYGETPEQVKMWFDQGCSFVACMVDNNFICKAERDFVHSVRIALGK